MSPIHPRLPAILLAAVAAATVALPAAARADVLVEIGNGDQVTGTFLPANEVERYLVRLPAGARLTASVAGKKRKGVGPTPSMRLLAPDGGEISTGALTATPSGAKLSGFVAPASGTYALELTAGSEGDYAFKAKWQNPTGVKQTIDFALDPKAAVELHAAPGTVASLKIASLPGEAGLPRLVQIASHGGSFVHDFAPPANALSPVHAATGIVLAADVDDYTLALGEDAAGAGKALLTVKLAPPKSKPRRIDLSSAALGTDPLNNFVSGSVIGPDGGIVSSDFAADPLSGASVSIPPGALPGPSVILVGPAQPITPNGDVEPHGPAVSFGPGGTTFATDATITLPFDADSFESDFSGLEVQVEDDEGNVSVVPDETVSVDGADGTVSFPTSHFSTYQVFGPPRPGRSDLNADGVDDLVMSAPLSGGYRGKMRIVLGRSGLASAPTRTAEVSIFGNGSESVFGYPYALGDIDADGTTDLVVGSYGFGSTYFGVARVFRGGPGFSPEEALDADFTIGTGTYDGGVFGALAVGDVTGDGAADLVIGAPSAKDVRGGVDGAVFVVPGGSAFGSTPTDGAGVIRIAGGVPGRAIGRSLALGDVTGDGVLDIVVAVAQDFGQKPSPPSLFVLAGGKSLASGVASPASTIYGNLGERLGTAIAVADFDGDGHADVAVGSDDAPSQTPGVPDGVVYWFRGPLAPVSTVRDAAAVIVCAPESGPPVTSGGGGFGSSMQAANVVGDPVRDLIVGCPTATPLAPAGAFEAGAYVVLRGGPKFGSDRRIETGTAAAAHLGCVVLPCADVDGDGRLDVIVAETEYGGDQGRVTVRLGPGLAGRTVEFVGSAGEAVGGGKCGD